MLCEKRCQFDHSELFADVIPHASSQGRLDLQLPFFLLVLLLKEFRCYSAVRAIWIRAVVVAREILITLLIYNDKIHLVLALCLCPWGD
jgi:hypothetical protein